jgi:hypothetical protein
MNGKRFQALDALLTHAKKNPGNTNLLVDADGSWGITYTKRQPAVAIIIDEAKDFNWEAWNRIEPIEVRRDPMSAKRPSIPTCKVCKTRHMDYTTCPPWTWNWKREVYKPQQKGGRSPKQLRCNQSCTHKTSKQTPTSYLCLMHELEQRRVMAGRVIDRF